VCGQGSGVSSGETAKSPDASRLLHPAGARVPPGIGPTTSVLFL
jgi:hypothetical protein